MKLSELTRFDKSMTTVPETFWRNLILGIQNGFCVPFLGSGACAGVLPTGRALAEMWAHKYGFPWNECSTLSEVAQYIEIKYDRYKLLDDLQEVISSPEPPAEPYSIFAELPFRMYITTNYDDFMGVALINQGKRPMRTIFPWDVTGGTMVLGEDKTDRETWYRQEVQLTPLRSDYEPSIEQPFVLHPHGHIKVSDSIVITEADYYRSLAGFVVGTFRLPIDVLYRLAKSTLLFIGYSLSDWNFRLLFHALHNRLGRINHAVVFLPEGTEDNRGYAERYLNTFTRAEVYFGTAKDFAAELKDRWGNQ